MRSALAFLTVLGGPRPLDARALRWFPVVGALVGSLVGVVWWASDLVMPLLLGAALVVVADLVVTGMLHVDGLADSADGLLPHADRERRLAIMRSPEVGAYGVTVVVAVLVVRVTALASQPVSIALLAAVWCASRATAAAAPAFVPYARESGLVSPLLDTRPTRWPVLAIAPAVVLAAADRGVAGATAVAVTVLVAGGVVGVATRRLGGFTGDVLGAAIVLGETAALVVAAAKW